MPYPPATLTGAGWIVDPIVNPESGTVSPGLQKSLGGGGWTVTPLVSPCSGLPSAGYAKTLGAGGWVVDPIPDPCNDLASQVAALFAAKGKIQQNTGDVSIAVDGDSTGDANTEWVYLFAQWLAVQYPTHSVSYRLWNDATSVYGAATAISTGSGANTIRIWNASVSGSQPIHLMGSKLTASLITPSPDLVIWNHGKNLVSTGADSLYRGGFIQGMDQVRQRLPGVAHAAFRQSPNRDDNGMAPVVVQLDSISAAYGDLALLDAYSKFIAAGKNPALYIDNVHPSNAGSQLFADALQEAWTAASAPSASAFPAFVSTLGTNLLTGITKFSDPAYTGGQPAGWASAPASGLTADTTIKDAGASQSLKFVYPTGALIYQQMDATALRGKSVTLAVRQYVPFGSAATVGRVAILVNNGVNVTTVATAGSTGNDGWRWLMIAGLAIPADAAYLRAYLYCDSAANTDSTVYYDRAILVEGSVPRNIP